MAYISGELNPADLFTKVLARDPFEKHRKFVLNLPGDTGAEYGKKAALQSRAGAAAKGQGSTASGTRETGAERRAAAS